MDSVWHFSRFADLLLYIHGAGLLLEEAGWTRLGNVDAWNSLLRRVCLCLKLDSTHLDPQFHEVWRNTDCTLDAGLFLNFAG